MPRPIEDIADERSERRDAIEHVGEILREYFREGACDVRLVVEGLGREEFDELDLPLHRRGTDGSSVKVDRLAIGCSVEFVAEPEPSRASALIPVERGAQR